MKRVLFFVPVLLLVLASLAAAQTRTYTIDDLIKTRRVGDPPRRLDVPDQLAPDRLDDRAEIMRFALEQQPELAWPGWLTPPTYSPGLAGTAPRRPAPPRGPRAP